MCPARKRRTSCRNCSRLRLSLQRSRSCNGQGLQKKYAGEVVWLAVNSTNKTASDYTEPAKLSTQLKDFGAAPARYLMDEPGTAGMAYGARTTPHMYIIDPAGKVVYNGAIDDKRSTSL